MDILQYIDASLEFGLRELEEEISKYSAISTHLSKYNELKKSKKQHIVKHHECINSLEVDSNSNKISAGSNGLQEILNKAKEIRNTSKSKSNRNAETNNGTKTLVKSITTSSGSKGDKHKLLAASLVDNNAIVEERCESFVNDLQSQLKLLAANEVKSPANVICYDKELQSVQCKLLTKLGKRILTPKNNVFQMVSDDILLYNVSKSAIYDIHNVRESHKLSESIFLNTLKRTQTMFESRLKIRLQTLAVGSKLKDLKCEILENWFRINRCFQLYDAYISDNNAIADNNSILHIINNLFKFTSSVTPYLIGNKSISVLSSDRWCSTITDKVNVYQNIFQNKIKYFVELVIGKYFLKNTVKRLKHCCEDKFTSDKHLNDELVSHWIATLKSFRDLYCALLTEAESSTCCVFVEKK